MTEPPHLNKTFSNAPNGSDLEPMLREEQSLTWRQDISFSCSIRTAIFIKDRIAAAEV